MLTTEEVRAIAWRIANEVSEAFPDAQPHLLETRPGVDIGLLEFEPPFPGAVAPTVMVNADASVEISISGEEDEAFCPSDPTDIDALVRYAVGRVLEIANNGAVHVRIPGFLGPLAASWLGVPGVDTAVDRALASRFARVHRHWLSWSSQKTAKDAGVRADEARMRLYVVGLYSLVDVAVAYDRTLLNPSAVPMVAARALIDLSDPSRELMELAGMASRDYEPDIVDALRAALREEGLEMPESRSDVSHDLTDYWLTCLAEQVGPADDLVWLADLYGKPDEIDVGRRAAAPADAIRTAWAELFAFMLHAEDAGRTPDAAKVAELAVDLLSLRAGDGVRRFAGVGYVAPRAGWGR